MKNLRRILVLLSVLPLASMANTVGVSAHPFVLKNKAVQTEFTGNFSGGSGVGVQARYIHKINQDLRLDGGVGIQAGERSSRVILGADYLLYPDHRNQPRISMKGTYERLREYSRAIDAIGITPTISKGITIGGNEAFPFIALPVKLKLDSDSQSYERSTSLAMGMTGPLPIKGYRHLIGNIETNVDIKNSYTGLYMGVTYPIQ